MLNQAFRRFGPTRMFRKLYDDWFGKEPWIDVMLLPKEAASHPDPNELLSHSGTFLSRVIHEHLFAEREIKPDLFCLSEIIDYDADVSAHGHVEYLSRANLHLPGREHVAYACRKGLTEIYGEALGPIYDELLDFVATQPALVVEIKAHADWMKYGEGVRRFSDEAWEEVVAPLSALDDLYYEEQLDCDAQLRRSRDWLAAQPWVKLVPKSDWPDAVGRLRLQNRHYVQRVAQRRRIAEANAPVDTLRVVIETLCDRLGDELIDIGNRHMEHCDLNGIRHSSTFFVAAGGPYIAFDTGAAYEVFQYHRAPSDPVERAAWLQRDDIDSYSNDQLVLRMAKSEIAT